MTLYRSCPGVLFDDPFRARGTGDSRRLDVCADGAACGGCYHRAVGSMLAPAVTDDQAPRTCR